LWMRAMTRASQGLPLLMCGVFVTTAAPRTLNGTLSWDEIRRGAGEQWPGPRYAAAAAALRGRGLLVTHGYLYDAERRQPRCCVCVGPAQKRAVQPHHRRIGRCVRNMPTGVFAT